MYSPLNLYAYIHWILDFKYILLLLDPFPTKLLRSHLSSITNIIIHIVNLCFSSSAFQHLVSPYLFPL